MVAPASDPSPDAKTLELQRAFDVFNQVSAELTEAYGILQGKVASLTQELAVANGALRQQYLEKEALSERLSLLLDALPAGVVVLDGLATVTDINPAAEKIFHGDIRGMHWGDVVQANLQPTLTIGEWVLGEQHLSLAESALAAGGGKILLINDVTANHRMKADMERNQRLAAMGEMAASLAHQLRTPLAAALLYAANLGQPGLSDDARSRFAGKATGQLQRLEKLIQEVLLFARGQRIGRDLIPAADLLHEAAQTMEPLMRQHGIGFTLEEDCADAEIIGGRKALFGALINLLENAMQALPSGGNICLSGSRHGNKVHLCVKDDGEGVSPALQARIFEPFFTTRGQGTGLGLAIAVGVARAHGGEIALYSEPGKGAEFVLRLPLSEFSGDLLDASPENMSTDE